MRKKSEQNKNDQSKSEGGAAVNDVTKVYSKPSKHQTKKERKQAKKVAKVCHCFRNLQMSYFNVFTELNESLQVFLQHFFPHTLLHI